MANLLSIVRTGDKQRRVLARYLENGGDKVDAYYNGLNKTPNPKLGAQAQRSIAYKYFRTTTMKALMHDADLKTKVAMERKSEAGLETAIEKYGITRDRILAELAKIAFATQTDVASWGPDGVIIKDSKDIGDAAGAVAEVSQSGGGEKSPVSVKVKLHDRRQALIDLGKEIGMFSDKVEHKGTVMVGAKFIVTDR
jgi:hypothetical protein